MWLSTLQATWDLCHVSPEFVAWNILMCVTAASRGRCEASPNNNNMNQLRHVWRRSDRFVSPPTGLWFNSTAVYELVLCSLGSHVSDGQVIWSSEWHHWEEMTSFKSQKKTESKRQSSETTVVWMISSKCSCLLTWVLASTTDRS